MVLIIDDVHIPEETTLIDLLTHQKSLVKRSQQLLASVRYIEEDKKTLYVGQREMAVIDATDDDVEVVGSDHATTCHILILRDGVTGVTGLAHIDSDNEEQVDDLVNAVNARLQDDDDGVKIHVSIVGGYSDSKGVSSFISNMIIRHLILSETVFILDYLCVGDINTVLDDDIPKPRTHGAVVDIVSGELCCCVFSPRPRGPDLDVRSLRLYKDDNTSLLNIYDIDSRMILIKPFSFKAIKNIDNLCKKSDQYLLSICSTSPEAEPVSFIKNLRSTLETMRNNPEPDSTLFPGGKSRQYCWSKFTRSWQLVGKDYKLRSAPAEKENCSWSVSDFRMSLSNL